jgi:hypothetical protein
MSKPIHGAFCACMVALLAGCAGVSQPTTADPAALSRELYALWAEASRELVREELRIGCDSRARDLLREIASIERGMTEKERASEGVDTTDFARRAEMSKARCEAAPEEALAQLLELDSSILPLYVRAHCGRHSAHFPPPLHWRTRHP